MFELVERKQKKHTEKKTTKKDCLEDFQTSIRGTYRKRKGEKILNEKKTPISR